MTPVVRGERDIVVVGRYGSQSRAVGFDVAKRLGRPFVATDSLLVLHKGGDARRIVEDSGLEELRRAETEMTRIALSASTAVIVAAPASLFDLDADALGRLLGGAWVVLLDDGPAESEPAGEESVAVEGHDVTDEVSELDEHLRGQRRVHALQRADVRIDVVGKSVDDVVDGVAEAWSCEHPTALRRPPATAPLPPRDGD